MDAMGFDSELAQQQALIAVLGVFVIFSVLAPLGGMFMYRVIRRYLPADELVVLMGTAFIIFLMSFALLRGILLRVSLFAGLPTSWMLLISLFGAALVTSVTAVAVRAMLRRGASPDAHSFGVWEEDARQRNSIGDSWPSSLRLRWLRRQKRLDQIPQIVRDIEEVVLHPSCETISESRLTECCSGFRTCS